MSPTELSVSQIKGKRIFYLVFATITLLVLGLIYAWSIFAAPIGANYESYKPLLPQVFQVSMFAFCLSALGGAQLIKKTSAKLTIIVAAILMAVGFVLTAYGAGMGVWALFIFYGIFAGSGCGIAYNAIISLVNPWFPDRIGFCSGVQMMGFGISSLVFGSVANAMFGIMDWTAVFIIIAIVAFIIMVVLAFTVKPAPKDIAQKLGLSGAAATTKQSSTQQQGILTTRVFWLYSVWATIVIACGLTLIGTAGQGATLLGFDAGFAALLVGLVSTMNGIGRIINGSIFDKAGLLPVMLIAAAFAIGTMICLAAALALSIGFLYVVAAILVAFPYSAVPVMASAYARQRYGAAGFAKNLGIANCNIASAAVINIVIVAVLGSPAAANGPIIYGLLAGLAVVAFLVSFVFGKVYKNDLTTIAKELE
ncbi:MAG: MFS transporter [Coriobacteriales bacterium]|jgi:OFA family oxalate/formate antiporter-like MFS transporter|nr:MFS transporter [Coriobacteriales bacterium]